MSLPILTFDGTCPVCVNYVRMLRKKIAGNVLTFQPTTNAGNEFQYTTSEGGILYGNVAIEQLAKDFPQVLDYFWMLPERYKINGLKAAYKVGSVVRKIITKGCNCGKKH